MIARLCFQLWPGPSTPPPPRVVRCLLTALACGGIHPCTDGWYADEPPIRAYLHRVSVYLWVRDGSFGGLVCGLSLARSPHCWFPGPTPTPGPGDGQGSPSGPAVPALLRHTTFPFPAVIYVCHPKARRLDGFLNGFSEVDLATVRRRSTFNTGFW